jgi:hypothetical protein
MAHYGKTLREELKASGGAEEDLLIGAPNKANTGRSVIVGILFSISLGFFYRGLWPVGVGLLVACAVLLFLNAPHGGAFYDNDNSVPPENQGPRS